MQPQNDKFEIHIFYDGNQLKVNGPSDKIIFLGMLEIAKEIVTNGKSHPESIIPQQLN